jgi:hypothetical protein
MLRKKHLHALTHKGSADLVYNLYVFWSFASIGFQNRGSAPDECKVRCGVGYCRMVVSEKFGAAQGVKIL